MSSKVQNYCEKQTLQAGFWIGLLIGTVVGFIGSATVQIPSFDDALKSALFGITYGAVFGSLIGGISSALWIILDRMIPGRFDNTWLGGILPMLAMYLAVGGTSLAVILCTGEGPQLMTLDFATNRIVQAPANIADVALIVGGSSLLFLHAVMGLAVLVFAGTGINIATQNGFGRLWSAR